MNEMEFNWIGNESQDDFTCRINGYCLRAEMMQQNVWWWCVYSPIGDSVSSYTKGKWGESMEEAKELAEKGYVSLVQTKVA